MSLKEATTASGKELFSLKIGLLLIDNHLRFPPGCINPITTSLFSLPVRRVTMAGNSSTGKIVPSSLMAFQVVLLTALPLRSDSETPSISAALRLEAPIVPSPLMSNTPSDNVSTTVRYLFSTNNKCFCCRSTSDKL